MALGDRLEHVAVRVREETEGDWIEGERDVAPQESNPFDCLLLFPTGSREVPTPRGRRTIVEPTLLFEPFDQTGADFALASEDEVLITAEEHAMVEERWIVEGDPVPLARPGDLIGYAATVKKVND